MTKEQQEAYKKAQEATLESGDASAARLRINEQAALMLNVDRLINKRKQAQGGDKIYENFCLFRDAKGGGGHLNFTKKIYRNDAVSSLMKKIPSNVLSALLPSIELYKVFFPNEYEKNKSYSWRIPFDDIPVNIEKKTSEFQKESINELLRGTGRMHGVGIKSFRYKYAGVNPAEINSNIEAELELFFQDVRDLVKAIPITYSHPNFVEPPPNNLPNLDFMYSHLAVDSPTKTLDGEYNKDYFRLKAIVGYTEPSATFLKNLIPDAKERESVLKAIRTAKIILYLNPFKHDIQFQENGNVILKIEFIAAMTSVLSDVDVLQLTDKHDKLDAAKKQYEDAIQSEKNEIQKLEKNCDKLPESVREEQLKNKREAARKQSFVEQTKLDNTRNEIYSEIFSRLVGINKAPPVGVIYSALFDKTALGVNTKGQALENPTQARIQNLGSAKTINGFQIDSVIDEDQKFLVLSKPPEEVKVPKSFLGINTTRLGIGNTDTDSTETAATYHRRLADKNQREELKGDNSFKVKFIFLGDLIDIFASVIHKKIKNESDKPRIVLSDFYIEIPKESKIEQGTDNIYNTDAEYEVVTINMADIPISIAMLQEFFIEKIIKPRRDEYPLVYFLNDILTDVVAPAIAPSVFGRKTVINRSIRMAYLNVTIPFINNQDALTAKSKDQLFSGILYENTLLNGISEASMARPAVESGNYLIFYCSNQVPKSVLNTRVADGKFAEWVKKDEDDGIYHFLVGTDTGFVKKITFSRIDSPFAKEAKAAGSNGDKQLGRLREVYDATITMFGNNIYRPGDFLYIEPLFFIGKEAVDLQNKLGLGGYYQVMEATTTINENIYETTIRCALAAFLENGEIKSADNKGGC